MHVMLTWCTNVYSHGPWLIWKIYTQKGSHRLTIHPRGAGTPCTSVSLPTVTLGRPEWIMAWRVNGDHLQTLQWLYFISKVTCRAVFFTVKNLERYEKWEVPNLISP